MEARSATEIQLGPAYPMVVVPRIDSEHNANSPTAEAIATAQGDEAPNDHIDSSDPIEPSTEYPQGLALILTLISTSLPLTLVSIDLNILAPALPAITDTFQTTSHIAWYASAFRLTLCAFQFLYGKAYTLFPIKTLFQLSTLTCLIGSILSGCAATSPMLVAGRAVSGLGAAGIFSGYLVILVQCTPLHRRPLFLGIMGGIEGIATLSAPLLGGVLTQSLGWRWCFWFTAPFAALSLPLTAYCFTERPLPPTIASQPLAQKLKQLDLLSNLVLIPALTSLFLALSWAGTSYPWLSAAVLTPLCLFFLLLILFLYLQFHSQSSLFPIHILTHRTILAGALFILCANSAGAVTEYYLPTYYQLVLRLSPSQSGLLLLPLILAAIIGSLLHGMGTSKWGHYAPFMLLASILMPLAAGLMTTFDATTTTTTIAKLILVTALSGLGYGIGFSGPQNAVQTSLRAEDVPLGIAIMLFAQSFGPAVSVAIAQVIFTNQLQKNLDGVFASSNGTMSTSSSSSSGGHGFEVANQGLSGIVASVPAEQAAQVLVGISRSITETWYLVVGSACATMVGTLCIEWRSVKTHRA
jgi:MFS family permease